jgi:hypothetical protein
VSGSAGNSSHVIRKPSFEICCSADINDSRPQTQKIYDRSAAGKIHSHLPRCSYQVVHTPMNTRHCRFEQAFESNLNEYCSSTTDYDKLATGHRINFFRIRIRPKAMSKPRASNGCPGRDRTYDQVINSHLLCH